MTRQPRAILRLTSATPPWWGASTTITGYPFAYFAWTAKRVVSTSPGCRRVDIDGHHTPRAALGAPVSRRRHHQHRDRHRDHRADSHQRAKDAHPHDPDSRATQIETKHQLRSRHGDTTEHHPGVRQCTQSDEAPMPSRSAAGSGVGLRRSASHPNWLCSDRCRRRKVQRTAHPMMGSATRSRGSISTESRTTQPSGSSNSVRSCHQTR